MSANPAQIIAASVAGIRRDMEELSGTLSGEEFPFIPEARAREASKAPLVAEIDCDMVIAGGTIPVTLAVYGRFTPARKGGHEPGERPYEPDDDAGFDVHAVMLGETDILGDIGEAGEEAIVGYVMENCE